MTIQEMHYDFKMKFNKIDSQRNRNLLVPEIDWLLNEAEQLFVNLVAFPRVPSPLGFEKIQRNTDDIRTALIFTEFTISSGAGSETGGEDPSPMPGSTVVLLPALYQYFIRATVEMTKGSCSTKGRVMIHQHDDIVESDTFYNSSFEWQEVTASFIGNLFIIKNPNDTSISKVILYYIRRRPYMHFASGFPGGTYTLPGAAAPLTGVQHCVLPIHTHGQIVDIAVAMAAGKIQASDYQIKLSKLSVNQLL